MTDPATVIARARFVAEHWRDSIMAGFPEHRWAAHPLAMVLAALDGEDDPAQCGIGAVAQRSWPPLQDPDGGRRGD